MTTPAAPPRWGLVETAYAVVILVSITLLVAIFGSIYYWANWNRMVDTCSVGGNMSYSFSVTHGFSCAATNGKSESKFWW